MKRIKYLLLLLVLVFAVFTASVPVMADYGDIIAFPLETDTTKGFRLTRDVNLILTTDTATDYLQVKNGNLFLGTTSSQTLNGSDAEIDGTLFADGALTVGGATTMAALTVSGAAIFNSTVALNGVTTVLNNTAFKLGASGGTITWDTTTSLVDITGNVNFAGTAEFDAGVTCDSTLTANSTIAANGIVTLANNIALKFGAAGGTITWDSVTSLVDYTGNENHTGTVEFDAGVTTDSTLTANGAITANSTIAANGIVTLANNIALKFGAAGGTITWDSTTSLVDYTGNENHAGTVEFDAGVTTDSTLTANGAITANSTVALNGATTVANNISLLIGAAGGTITWDTTTSLVDITGNVNFAGTVEHDGTTQFDAASVFNSTVALNGVPTIANNIGLKFGASGGSITWDTTTSLVDIVGNVNFAGTVEFDAGVTCDSTLALNGTTTLANNTGLLIGAAGGSITWDTTTSLVDAAGNWNFEGTVQFGDAITANGAVGLNDVVTLANDTNFNIGSAGASMVYDPTGAEVDMTGTFAFGSAIELSNGETIANGTDEIIDLSSADYGVKLPVVLANPQGTITSEAGASVIYAETTNYYYMVCAGGTTWWGMTMEAGTSIP